jgi:MoxR-like ATPase
MPDSGNGLVETVTLKQARALLRVMAHEQSLLLLSPPGVGKSDTVLAAAADAGLPCRSLLGTQIAPEDVSGIPRIVGERSVFCPPRILLPEKPEPFCLFLDELPATSPDVQKAFYSLLLERRLGEHRLPQGTWVVAAGNRAEDRALVRSLSSALVNRVIILQVRVDVPEWLQWAGANRIRPDILAFINFIPESLMRPVPVTPVPFSTPRSWASLSRAMDLAEAAGILDRVARRALAFGRISAEDAAVFCAMAEDSIGDLLPVRDYILEPEKLPSNPSSLWFLLCRVRRMAQDGDLRDLKPVVINRFLSSIPLEQRLTLFVDLVDNWGKLGADPALLAALRELTGL